MISGVLECVYSHTERFPFLNSHPFLLGSQQSVMTAELRLDCIAEGKPFCLPMRQTEMLCFPITFKHHAVNVTFWSWHGMATSELYIIKICR